MNFGKHSLGISIKIAITTPIHFHISSTTRNLFVLFSIHIKLSISPFLTFIFDSMSEVAKPMTSMNFIIVFFFIFTLSFTNPTLFLITLS